MNFANSSVLILLILIPLGGIFFRWRSNERAQMLAKLGDPSQIRVLSSRVDQRQRMLKSALWLFALSCVIIAAARPAWGVTQSTVEVSGAAVMVVLDVSVSMDAQDVLPSRLDRARLTARELFDEFEGGAVGLVLFAGTGFVQLPLTTDRASAATFLNAASSDSITQQGTAIEPALRLAMRSFDQRNLARGIIVLMSDGENHEGDPLAAAEEAAERGIQIHVLGYGADEGAPIPLHGSDGQIIGYKSDQFGNLVLTRLNESILQQIAGTTGGIYRRASSSGIEVFDLLNAIQQSQGIVLEPRSRVRSVERFGLFVLLAVIALGIEIVLPETRSKVISYERPDAA